jgi:hypothetical protein
MPEQIDQEVDAIKALLSALEPLSSSARISVIGYVVRRLQIVLDAQSGSPTAPGVMAVNPAGSSQPAQGHVAGSIHLKEFKEQKKPRSANEMAALVAYFLSELAPVNERKGSITAKDIETQFKIGGFPLAGRVQMTLPNAKSAGYFDSAGDGEYRLNAVGHNLVVHSMPRGASAATRTAQKRARKSSSKKK